MAVTYKGEVVDVVITGGRKGQGAHRNISDCPQQYGKWDENPEFIRVLLWSRVS
jgi:hypothetical protein